MEDRCVVMLPWVGLVEYNSQYKLIYNGEMTFQPFYSSKKTMLRSYKHL